MHQMALSTLFSGDWEICPAPFHPPDLSPTPSLSQYSFPVSVNCTVSVSPPEFSACYPCSHWGCHPAAEACPQVGESGAPEPLEAVLLGCHHSERRQNHITTLTFSTKWRKLCSHNSDITAGIWQDDRIFRLATLKTKHYGQRSFLSPCTRNRIPHTIILLPHSFSNLFWNLISSTYLGKNSFTVIWFNLPDQQQCVNICTAWI